MSEQTSRPSRSSRIMHQPRVVAFLVFLLLMLMTLPAWAEEAPELRDEWRMMKTPNFVLLGDASERQMEEVGESLEGLHSFLSQMSSGAVEAPVPTFVYVFKNKRSFDPYRLLQPNGEPLDITGFFSRRQHANYLAIDGSSRDAMIGVTLHEYVHFFVSYRLLGIPVWFNEGLAEFYSTFESVRDYVNIGKIIPGHLAWLKQNTMIPLLDLFAVSHDSPEYNESDRRGVFYAQSWALVHYLFLERENGREQLIEFLKLQSTMPREDAFKQAFGSTPKELFRKLRKYVRSSRFTYRRTDFSIEKQRQAFRFSDIADAQALARLGELLAVQDREEEARRHLQAALDIDREEARAFVGLGLLERRAEGDVSAAVDHFTAARRLAPEDRSIIFLQAEARARRGDPGTSLRRDLVKVVNANPRFLDAWRLLAWAWSGEMENIEEATRVFEGAFATMPDNQSYAENLLYYYDRGGRTEAAEKLMDRYFRPRGLDPRRATMVFNDGSVEAVQAQGGQGELAETQVGGVLIKDPATKSFYDKIERANQLMAEQKYGGALEIYEKLVAESPNDTQLRAKRDELRKVVAHNGFITAYNEAVRLFGLYEWRKAAEQLEPLLKWELSSEHRWKAEKLYDQAKAEWQKRGESGL